ncbi:MAG TPA: sulfate adenylyltransferase subunit CysD [Burkholderiales bacterium]|nr:sulfate adenylyltransferase subunit CysD [Betaproteobacteria bacterium]HQR51719.1 sulfate adenylyltransferase subunit CysD [Burkholderiales bacterium]
MKEQERYSLSVLGTLEAESIHILREVAAECERPVMMYSVGKDSSAMVRLAQKAFHPGRIPFPLLHIDTSYKFPEMYEFRDRFCSEIGVDLRVHGNQEALAADANPWDLGTVKCCALLKTQGLLGGLREGEYDAVIGGARREEERSRAKERIYSFRDAHGQWDPKNQRPELWNLYNGKVSPGESIRVFPLSNWTELDVWRYIELESIPVVPLYFAQEREVVVRGSQLIPVGEKTRLQPGESPQRVMCRYRTLGCYPCTGAVRSTAQTVREIIDELQVARHSERITRIIDHDQDGSMEQKKREGYF